MGKGALLLAAEQEGDVGQRQSWYKAKGAIVDFGDVHTRAHVYRAILEGLAYALREGKERIDNRSGVRILALRLSGGILQSDVAMQFTADILAIERYASG